MLLAVDIGNTNIVVGVFNGTDLRATWRIATDVNKMVDEYRVILDNLLPREGLSLADIDAAILSSVVPTLIPVFENVCQRCFKVKPLVVGSGIRTGLRILYDNPRDLGADRIVDAVAAYRQYGGPVIVVDFGTATVFNAVSGNGDYLGGAIAPGVAIAADALFKHTSKLPRVELIRPRSAIGKNTTASIQSGLIFGYVGLVEGVVARFQRELGDGAKVVATGGLADIIARETNVVDIVDPGLTLKGLHIIYGLNKASAVEESLIRG